MLKVQLHCHCYGDPVDHINYTAKELIDEAKKLQYDALTITLHKKLFFNKKIYKYAAKQGVLLIPGIEFEINEKHIVAVNAHQDILTVDDFKKLATYRQNHPETLIIAPHPFFPTKYCLGKDLIDNILLFDAIEISWSYTKTKDYNKKAIELAKRWRKPLVATADCHILKDLNIGYTLVEARKDPVSIVKAIRKNNLENYTKPTSYFKIAKFMIQIPWQTYKAKLKKNRKSSII